MSESNNRFGLDLGLGKHQDYQDQYNPDLLQPIARSICRQHLPFQQFNGVDLWTGYELSWLNEQGIPRAAIAEFSIPASSSNIIESKSFKYYLNSFNQTRISEQDLKQRIINDLSVAADATVSLSIMSLDDYEHPPTQLQGFKCVDNRVIQSPAYKPLADLILPTNERGTQQLYSHLLKSNCPVTGQPDWASVWIELNGAAVSEDSFLAYIVSYREHQDFHENCVEQIYCDLWSTLKPTNLWVYARYTRRGGLDINPFRCSGDQHPPKIKAARQ